MVFATGWGGAWCGCWTGWWVGMVFGFGCGCGLAFRFRFDPGTKDGGLRVYAFW